MQEIDPENYDPDLIYNWCKDEDRMLYDQNKNYCKLHYSWIEKRR